MPEERILCQTPTPGKKGTRILAWKHQLVREAILASIPEGGSVAFKELPALVAERLSEDDLARLGSVSWYTTTVKLDLEVRGEIERVPGVNPQKLRRTRPRPSTRRSARPTA